MVVEVIKRDGRKENFNRNKIRDAVLHAFHDVDGEESKADLTIAEKISDEISNVKKKSLHVEDIQDMVVNKLMATSRKDVASRYVEYRYRRKLVR